MISDKEIAHALGYHAKAHCRAKCASDFAPVEYRNNIDLQLAFVAGWKEAIADDEVNRLSQSSDAKYDSLVSAIGMLSKAMEELRRTVERQNAPQASLGIAGASSGGRGGSDMTFNPDGTLTIRGGGGAGSPIGGGGGGDGSRSKGTSFGSLMSVGGGGSATESDSDHRRRLANEAMVEHYQRLTNASMQNALLGEERERVKQIAQEFAIKDYEVRVLPPVVLTDEDRKKMNDHINPLRDRPQGWSGLPATYWKGFKD